MVLSVANYEVETITVLTKNNQIALSAAITGSCLHVMYSQQRIELTVLL